MSDYAVLITTSSSSYMLDAVEGFQITENNEMTSHPMVSGDVVGDHIIVHPCSISFSGSISLNASSPVKSLSTVQKIFEDLKDDGILCTVAKVKTSNNEFRFLKRQNMVLTGIVWTEKINSLDFNFVFTQVLLDNVQVTEVSKEKFLPDVIKPRTLTFQGTLISAEDLYKQIIQALIETKVVDIKFLEQAEIGIGLLGVGIAGAFVLGSAASTALAASATGLAAAGAASSTVPVAGWVVAAGAFAAAAALGLTLIITEAIEASKLKFKAFKADFKDYEEERAENERFAKMMDAIYEHVSIVNEWFKYYSFESDEPQSCMLNIGGTYHVLTFNRNNIDEAWVCDITSFDGSGESQVCSTKTMTFAEQYGTLSANEAFCEIKSSTGAADSSYYIYFVGNGKLTESVMLIASKEPSKFTDALVEVIKDAIYV